MTRSLSMHPRSEPTISHDHDLFKSQIPSGNRQGPAIAITRQFVEQVDPQALRAELLHIMDTLPGADALILQPAHTPWPRTRPTSPAAPI